MDKEYINIDATRRVIESKPSILLGILGDENAERAYFKVEKIVGDNVDLSKLHLYIKYAACDRRGARFTRETQIYHCEDVQDCGDYITFSWLMSGGVFSESGFVAYSVLAANSETVRWNTYPAVGLVGMTVPGGLEEIAEKYPDVITQLLERMDEIEAIEIPTLLSQLSDDVNHRTVTDKEKEAWNNKLDKAALNQAVTDSLQQAKESGEFKGADGVSITSVSIKEVQ